MNISKIKSATSLSYNPDLDLLFADGEHVGSASSLTREIMLSLLHSPEEYANESDETIFDSLVETVSDGIY